MIAASWHKKQQLTKKPAFDKGRRGLYHGALMAARKPEMVNVARLIAAGSDLHGHLPLQSLERLGDMLVESEGEVEYNLHFGRDEQGRQMITGELGATVVMQCQRCLAPVSIRLQRPMAWECVWSEAQFPNIAPGHDPYLMVEEPVPLAGLVEDELILSLPLVARHEADEACAPPRFSSGEDRQEQPDTRESHPLAELARLKRKD